MAESQLPQQSDTEKRIREGRDGTPWKPAPEIPTEGPRLRVPE